MTVNLRLTFKTTLMLYPCLTLLEAEILFSEEIFLLMFQRQTRDNSFHNISHTKLQINLSFTRLLRSYDGSLNPTNQPQFFIAAILFFYFRRLCGCKPRFFWKLKLELVDYLGYQRQSSYVSRASCLITVKDYA